MNFEILVTYVFSVFVFIFTPGPVVALVLKNATKSFKNAFITIIGTNLASLILILIASSIILGLFKISENLLTWLSFFGAIFIIYFGTTSLLSDLKNTTFESSEPIKNKNAFLQGFAIAISNPKDIIFFIAFFPQFIEITNDIKTSLITLTVLWILLDFSLLLFYAKAMSSKFLFKQRQKIAIFSDIVLILIGFVALFVVYKSLNF
ncbi:MAG: LysE family translocator [Campylobacteraceae bacterium]|nr:LysE family translocator [Campylobacteraceae bacterium]